MFNFLINGTPVDDPIDLKDYKESIVRDYDIRGILAKHPMTLTFGGNGNALLYAIKMSGSYCGFAELEIRYACEGSPIETIFNGLINIANIEFNVNKCTANCKIDDNSYSAMIFNNREIKAYLSVGKSKNGVDITPCTAISGFQFIDLQTGAATLGNTCQVFDAGDAFEFILRFMTDGAVGFVSTWYTGLPASERYAIGNAAEIRLQTGLAENMPYVSFDDIFSELSKKYKLFFAMETDASGNVFMRIEEEDYFFKTTTALSTPFVQDLLESTDFTRLYSEISLGAEDSAQFTVGKWDLPIIRYVTFRKEKYIIKGTCNVNRTLDTVSKWIIDSNIIQGLTQTDTANDAYDEKIVLVQYDSGTNEAVVWNTFFVPPPYFYNGQITNDKVAARWNVQGDLAAYITNVDTTFRASRTSAVGPNAGTFSENPIPYPDDFTPPNNDPSGSYNAATYRFTSPAQGGYGFHVFQRIDFTRVTFANPVNPLSVLIYLRHYNAASTLLETIVLNTKDIYVTGLYDIEGNHLFSLDAGDYVIAVASGVDSTGDTISWYFDILGYFECTFSLNGGTIPGAQSDPALYRVLKFAYNFPIANSIWQSMLADPAQALMFGTGGAIKKGWINKIERDIVTSNSVIELITNYENSK